MHPARATGSQQNVEEEGGRGWGSQCAASLIGAHYPQRQTTTTTATDDKAEKKTRHIGSIHCAWSEEGWQLWQRLPTTMSRRALIPVIYATCPHTHASAHTHTHTEPHLHKFCNRQKQKRSGKRAAKSRRFFDCECATINCARLRAKRGKQEGGIGEGGLENTSYGVRLLSESLAKFKRCLLCKRKYLKCRVERFLKMIDR